MPKPVLPPLHGVQPPKQPANPPPTIPGNGWYLCINQAVYGPYSVAQLVESAKDGRIGMDDTLLHAMATNNAWVAVTRLPMVSMHIRPAPPSLPAHKTAPVAPVTPRSGALKSSRRSGGIRWFRDVVTPMVSLSLLVMAYLHFTEHSERPMQASVQTPPPSSAIANQDAALAPSRSRTRPARREEPREEGSLRNRSTDDRPLSPTDNESDSDLPRSQPLTPRKTNGNLGDLIRDEETMRPREEPFLIVDLELNAGFQLVDLPEIPPNRRLAVSRFTSPTKNQDRNPSDGVINDSRPVLVLPYGDRSVFMEVKGLSEDGKISKLRIECKTDFDWLGGDTLSLERLKRKRISMIKQRVPTHRFDNFCTILANTFTGAKLELVVIE